MYLLHYILHDTSYWEIGKDLCTWAVKPVLTLLVDSSLKLQLASPLSPRLGLEALQILGIRRSRDCSAGVCCAAWTRRETALSSTGRIIQISSSLMLPPSFDIIGEEGKGKTSLFYLQKAEFGFMVQSGVTPFLRGKACIWLLNTSLF